MLQDILIVSAIFQWILMVVGVTLILALMRLVGGLEATVHAGHQTSLKGVNIGSLFVYDAHQRHDVQMQELLGGEPRLLVLVDPTCAKCQMQIERLISAPTFQPENAIFVVRGSPESAHQFAAEQTIDMRTISEHSELMLAKAQAPFAVIVDESAGYIASVALADEESVAETLRLFEAMQARKRMMDAESDSSLVQGGDTDPLAVRVSA